MVKTGIFLGLYAAVGIAGWTAYDMLNGKEPILTKMGVTTPAMEQVTGMFSSEKKQSNTLYRWQDENGQWHYGSEPPGDRDSQALNYDPTAELEQLKRLPSSVLPTGGKSSLAETSEDSGFLFPGIPNMNEVAELIKEATDMQSKAEDRKAQIDSMINQQ